jgi:pyrimidine-nucleoside phosphorylase
VNARTVIRAKRDGGELSDREIAGFLTGFLSGEVTPYQMSAFLMAVFFRGMSARETATLTRVMVETGEVLAFPEVSGLKVDKHSTGGVGDLISLPLAPLVAAAGVPVPMISGRGLGHTGGTLDKLESIPGLRTDLDAGRFRRVLAEVGFVMGGQTDSLAPADRRMYALRDVTATVESVPLIVSSILSKKVAEGIDALVLDVKCGRGAFMKTEEDALNLAGELTRVGTLMGKRVVAFITDMDLPLGSAVGNAVEVRSALEVLAGKGPEDVVEVVNTLGSAMLLLGGKAGSWAEAEARIATAAADGSGRERFRAMVEAQGGDGRVVEDPSRLPAARVEVSVPAAAGGFVTDVDPFAIGEAVVELGGGRRKAEDRVDPSVGILLDKRYGDRVERGDVLARVLASSEASGERAAEGLVGRAYRVEATAPAPRTLIKHLVTADGSTPWRGGATWDSRNGKEDR